MKYLILVLCFLNGTLSFAQQDKYYRIEVEVIHLPVANYETYIYEIKPQKKQLSIEYKRQFYEEKGGKETKKKSNLKLEKDSLFAFESYLNEEKKDSTSVMIEMGKDIHSVLYVDSIFRKETKKRDISLLAAQLDGTHLSIKIYLGDKKESKMELFSLDSDLTITKLRLQKNEIKWLKLYKILSPILPHLENPLLENYFSVQKKEALYQVYKEKEG